MIDKSFLGRRRYQPKSSTCAICKRPFVGIEKIHVKGNRYVYHCTDKICTKRAQEMAEVLIEDYNDGNIG
jgi:hypothetical protein